MLSNNLKRLRATKGLTQKELAQKSGITRESIGNYERGDRIPTTDVLVKIANALEVNLNDLLGSDKEEIKKNFKEVSKMTTVEREIETLKHIEEILKISETIGYENCFNYFKLLTTEEKLRFNQDLRKYMSQHLKTYLYLNRRYETLSSNEKSKFEVLDSETIESVHQTLTFN